VRKVLLVFVFTKEYIFLPSLSRGKKISLMSDFERDVDTRYVVIARDLVPTSHIGRILGVGAVIIGAKTRSALWLLFTIQRNVFYARWQQPSESRATLLIFFESAREKAISNRQAR
jgi:hypothetical protein